MYYDLNGVELTSKEVRLLRKINKQRKFENPQGILQLAAHDLIRHNSSNSFELTGSGKRFLDMEKDKFWRRLIWSVLVPIATAIVTSYLTTALLL